MGRVDTSVLLEAEAFNSLVTNNNVRSGRFELDFVKMGRKSAAVGGVVLETSGLSLRGDGLGGGP